MEEIYSVKIKQLIPEIRIGFSYGDFMNGELITSILYHQACKDDPKHYIDISTNKNKKTRFFDFDIEYINFM